MSAIIRVDNLTRRYGERTAVDHIAFEVAAGVLPPSEGTAHVLDHDMARDPLGAKEHIGVVPEVANPYLEMTGWQNLMLAGELYDMKKTAREERAEKLLRDLGLWDRRADRAKAYSKGMRQRLMLAMALLHQPDILFLDEPTAGLDVMSRRNIHQMVKDLTQSGVTVFYTTHNVEEANVLCDRVAIISEGRLAAVDTPEALKNHFAESQSVQVAFASPVEPEALSGIPSVAHVEKEGDKLRLFTSNPGRVATEIALLAQRQGLELVSLNTLGPSLEEVFLSITGRGARPREVKQ